MQGRLPDNDRLTGTAFDTTSSSKCLQNFLQNNLSQNKINKINKNFSIAYQLKKIQFATSMSHLLTCYIL